MVFEEVLLNLIMQACQLTYFDRQANLIKFIRTYPELDLQLDQVQNFIMLCIYLSIFYSMLKIFIMQSNRELSICDRMIKIFSTMTKISMVFLVCVCVCMLLVMKTWTLIYRGI